MKVVCIDNKMINSSRRFRLTIGKIYTSLNKQKDWNLGILIENDNGIIRYYDEEMFKSLDEVRQNKLEELGV